MSTLFLRDGFGDRYVLAPATLRPDSTWRLEPTPPHLAHWVLRQCTMERAGFGRVPIDELGRLVGDTGRLVLWRIRDERPPIESGDAHAEAPLLSDLAAPAYPEAQTWFEVVVVDEAGEPVCGVDVLFSVVGAKDTRITDGSGRARFCCNAASFGSASFVAPEEVRNEVAPRWKTPRERVEPTDPVVTRMHAAALGGDVSIESKVPHVIVVQPPPVPLARLRGLLFDTNKTFLLPTAIAAMRSARAAWEASNPAELVIAGHTDTTSEPGINDPLSQGRADSVKAYLLDDVDAWLANYDAPDPQRWGRREDRLMITGMPDLATREPGEDLVRWFQRTRGLTVDGKAGPKTRRALVTEYLAQDGPPPSEVPNLHVSIATLGFGERHPVAQDGETLDEAPADDTPDAHDRRVELFFFDAAFGVLPPPTTADGPEYAIWRERAQLVQDDVIAGIGNEVEVLELHDALFRLDSAVVLPEGETPDDDGHTSLGSVGIFATLLRFNEERPGRRLLIAGHTDTSGGEAHNQELSEERARCALAILMGDREAFVQIADARHKVADYKQILSWCTAAFGDREIGEGGFDCAPAKIDDVAFTAIEPLKRFQAQYNDNRAALGVPEQPALAVDGAIGPKTWGAFFDVYQHALAEELDEDAAGVAALRDALVFVREGDEALGFGEHHPIDQPHRDSFRSQTNRRVEMLLFDSTTEVDIDLAKSDPDLSDVYLPGRFRRLPIEPMVSAKRWRPRWEKQDEPAQHLSAREMILDAPGLPAGTAILFEVEASIDEGEAHQVAAISAVSDEGRCVASFDGWAGVVREPDPERELVAPFPRATFTFTATGGGRIVTAKRLAYADDLDITFTHAEGGAPCRDTHFFVLTSWGFLEGITADDGRVAVSGLPPGGARATLAHVNAVEQPNG